MYRTIGDIAVLTASTRSRVEAAMRRANVKAVVSAGGTKFFDDAATAVIVKEMENTRPPGRPRSNPAPLANVG